MLKNTAIQFVASAAKRTNLPKMPENLSAIHGRIVVTQTTRKTC